MLHALVHTVRYNICITRSSKPLAQTSRPLQFHLAAAGHIPRVCTYVPCHHTEVMGEGGVGVGVGEKRREVMMSRARAIGGIAACLVDHVTASQAHVSWRWVHSEGEHHSRVCI